MVAACKAGIDEPDLSSLHIGCALDAHNAASVPVSD